MNRRRFLANTGFVAAGMSMSGLMGGTGTSRAQQRKGPLDYIIVQGHYDIWEFNDRLALRRSEHNSPLRDHILPRLLEAGVNVVIMPAGGDSVDQRGGSEQLLAGSMRTTDMLHVEIEKTNGRASIIKSKKDLPEIPDPNHVKFFLDFEGGQSIAIDPQPEYHPDRRLALLRNFFRLGVRGLQLTHHSRNQLGDGWREGDPGNKLSRFGVEVVEEMNRLGMMVGVSHLSANGIYHAAEVSTKPIVSTHQNPRKFIDTPLQLSDDEIKAIASTGGIAGVRYHSSSLTPYDRLVDMIEYIADLVGIEHTGFAWLGHDEGHPRTGYVPGVSEGPAPDGIEGMSKYEQFSRFIELLDERFTQDEIALIMGGNFLRIWKDILPD